jgi:type IV pilus assembly protein PilO
MNFKAFSEQFQGLDPQDIARWPSAPKLLVLLFLLLILLAAGWFLYLDGKLTELDNIRNEEAKYKKDYSDRLRKAVHLDALKKQKVEVGEFVNQMERQLPSKAEMDQLLSEINRAGLSRGLQFDLFRPGAVRIDNFYAELPIAVKVTGTYHKIAGFAADLSALPRIVTLNNMIITPLLGSGVAPGMMTYEATAKTFRYLDPEEVAAQKKSAQAAGAKK